MDKRNIKAKLQNDYKWLSQAEESDTRAIDSQTEGGVAYNGR